MNNNDTLKELKLWLCASLKNAEASLVCESIKETKENEKEIIETLNEVIEKLQKILIILQNNNMNKCHCKEDGVINEDEQRGGN